MVPPEPVIWLGDALSGRPALVNPDRGVRERTLVDRLKPGAAFDNRLSGAADGLTDMGGVHDFIADALLGADQQGLAVEWAAVMNAIVPVKLPWLHLKDKFVACKGDAVTYTTTTDKLDAAFGPSGNDDGTGVSA